MKPRGMALMAALAITGNFDYQIDGPHQRTHRNNEAPLAVTPLHANVPRGRKLSRAQRKAMNAKKGRA